jgi:nitroreductase
VVNNQGHRDLPATWRRRERQTWQVEYSQAVRRRRMVRSFSPTPVDPALVHRLLDDALRAPSAGHSRGTAWIALEGAETARYWDTTTTPEWRATSRRFEGLSRAPVVVVSTTSPELYVTRYGEDDKLASGLGPREAGGAGVRGWPVPYWWGDAAFAVMTLLLGAQAAGLGACFLGNFRGEEALCHALGVPEGWRVFGTVLLGFPDGADHRSASLDRQGPDRGGRVHYGSWDGERP